MSDYFNANNLHQKCAMGPSGPSVMLTTDVTLGEINGAQGLISLPRASTITYLVPSNISRLVILRVGSTGKFCTSVCTSLS